MRYVKVMKLDGGSKAEAKPEVVRPDDWPFMEQSEKVLANIPDTWKQYPADEAGMMGIINMEHCELKRASTDEDKMHELVHLASACLHMWRMLNDK